MVQSVFNKEEVSAIMAHAADILDGQTYHVQRACTDGNYGCAGTCIGRAAYALYPKKTMELQEAEDLLTYMGGGYSEGALIGHDLSPWSSSWLLNSEGKPTSVASFNDTHTKAECVKALRTYAERMKHHECSHQG